MTTVRDLGEHALIARLRSRVTNLPAHIEIGIGDDAAAIAPPRSELEIVTTDALIEGVHFRRDWTAPDAIGHKALAVNLSDLAAMGATPRAALLSLALPETLPVAEFDALLDGFLALAAATATQSERNASVTTMPDQTIVGVLRATENTATKLKTTSRLSV